MKKSIALVPFLRNVNVRFLDEDLKKKKTRKIVISLPNLERILFKNSNEKSLKGTCMTTLHECKPRKLETMQTFEYQ